MDYHFENLNPERFQEFCQALLIHEFHDIQCFPVAQPDGGRDAVGYFPEVGPDEKLVVYQVKFVRKPQAEVNPHTWITNIMKQEAAKVKRLIKKGAIEYYLITNVRGTSHLNSGSIDQVYEVLSQEIGIPVRCWWRDDLNRRLDAAWDLKWVYPELMTGIDMLRVLIESGLSEESERRTSTIRTFIKGQYDWDREVRFKQIELENNLLELFIDVPLNFSSREQPHDEYPADWRELLTEMAYDSMSENELNDDAFRTFHFHRRPDAIGAATFLLHPRVQEAVPQVVLEGAPGQGKSTLAQFICQVHRIKLLGLEQQFTQLPEVKNLQSIRIPFRVDLRDFASWLQKHDPFSVEPTEAPKDWYRSLESFLAAVVRFYSGGRAFSVDDLYAVAKISNLLLVFDGFDEVADVPKREEIVREVVAGIGRLNEISGSIQVVITSRPAAFVNSPGFPRRNFPHLELASITRNQIFDYADKWCKARRLEQRETHEVKNSLRDKLDQPHMRELTRNPMQLAILLSLIQSLGSSLPDKRTALYDSYIERFFNREAEKSMIVRKYRDVLVDIHGYLAWTLHSEAEQGDNQGRISADRLKTLLAQYLTLEGRDPRIAELLFTGMVERVVALVSRVEGTYEFEVQPLREYFAARYLYNTAPYSPVGAPKAGTKPERFAAMARNFYWLNVVRFYAGCYSKGELPSLADGLEELAGTQGYRDTDHPWLLAAMLLSDWVFAQNPRSMAEVTRLITHGEGVRYALTSGDRHVQRLSSEAGTSLILPPDCGQRELIELGVSVLRADFPSDRSAAASNLLKANMNPASIKDLWYQEACDVSGTSRTRWFTNGLYLGVIQNAPDSEIETLLGDDPLAKGRLFALFHGDRSEVIERSIQRTDKVIDAILSCAIQGFRRTDDNSVLSRFALAISTFAYPYIFYSPDRMPMNRRLRNLVFDRNDKRLGEQAEGVAESGRTTRQLSQSLEKCFELVEIADQLWTLSTKQWANSIEPWNTLIEASEKLWGTQWATYALAAIASSAGDTLTSLSNSNVPFTGLVQTCQRAMYARSKSDHKEWWQAQLLSTMQDLDLMFLLLLLNRWGSYDSLIGSLEIVDNRLCHLSPDRWTMLADVLQKVTSMIPAKKGRTLAAIKKTDLPETLSARTAVFLACRANRQTERSIYQNYLIAYDGSDYFVLNYCQQRAFELLCARPRHWEQHLDMIKTTYKQGVYFALRPPEIGVGGRLPLPLEAAQKIVRFHEEYPLSLVVLAEQTCREDVASKIQPVGRIADEQGWFQY